MCSPLRRALQTAKIIGAAGGLEPVVDDRLRERMNWGDAPFEQSLDAFLADWAHATRDRAWIPPSGDSSNATAARFLELLDEIVTQGQARRVLIVAHGGATIDLLRTLFGDATVRAKAAHVIDEGLPACSLTVVVHDTDWQLERIGATERDAWG
jgi:2,3-bisphosphoglycerate-dependent phosphoglycerate mutase/probable phosphoglycerate mutase